MVGGADRPRDTDRRAGEQGGRAPPRREDDVPPALKLSSDDDGPAAGDTPRFFRRFAWFVGIWALSVSFLLLVSAVLRWWLLG